MEDRLNRLARNEDPVKAGTNPRRQARLRDLEQAASKYRTCLSEIDTARVAIVNDDHHFGGYVTPIILKAIGDREMTLRAGLRTVENEIRALNTTRIR